MGTIGIAPELRPLSLGELLDRTFALYRSHFWLFVGIMAIPSAFSVPSSAVFLSTRGLSVFNRRPPVPPSAGSLLLSVSFFLLFGIVYAMAIGASTFAVSEVYLGQKATVRGSYGRIRSKWIKIIGVVSAAALRSFGMLVVIGTVAILFFAGVAVLLAGGLNQIQTRPAAAIFVGISVILLYFATLCLWVAWSVRYAVCIPTLLLEDLKVLPALRRSVKLTQGRLWQMFVAVAICGIIGYAGVIVFQGPILVTMIFSSRGGPLPEWLAYLFATSGAVGGAITGPLLLIILVLYYYDARIRKEAFDLQFMMSSLDNPAPAPGFPLPG